MNFVPRLRHFALSRFVLSAILASGLLSNAGIADDAAIAKQLESHGGSVTRMGDAVVEVMFRDSSQLGDAEWRSIGQLTHLKKLTTYGGARGLNDETVGYLANLQKLESLANDGAQLSDAGLVKLAVLTNLRSAAFFHLSFRKPGFTGTGFAAWQALPKLERLTVAGMSMGDAGFAAIAKLQHLRELRTWHTYRTEASNIEIAKLPRLTSLKLGQRLPRGKSAPLSLSDNSLATIATIQTLESLEIGEARFTLAGLSLLKRLPNLQRLKIDRSEITSADIDRLRDALPNVKITFEPLTNEQREKLKPYLQ